MRIAALALVGAAALLLAGCAPAAHPTGSPKPTATPLFASDAEALAAAEKAYANYEAAVDRSLMVGDDSGLPDVATGRALTNAKSSVASFRESNQHQSGASAVTDMRPADLSGLMRPVPTGGQIYACLDVSNVRVLDHLGNEVQDDSGQQVFPILATVNWVPRFKSLLVSDETVWNGRNFCS